MIPMDKRLLSDNAQHIKIEGTTFSMRDDTRLLEKKNLLADRQLVCWFHLSTQINPAGLG